MSRGGWLNTGRENVELSHDLVEILSVLFDYFHRFKLFEAGLLGDLILAFVCIAFEVPNVGDVADVADFVAQEPEVTKYDVEGVQPVFPLWYTVWQED